MLEQYKPSLAKLYKNYYRHVFDDTTGLINKYIHLSGAKDITKRNSAFYDNVVFWKTTQLAQKLGIIAKNKQYLADLKNRIIHTFWYAEGGYFLEDLSNECIKNNYYSSDWLIAIMTGFLSLDVPGERAYIEKSISYIRKEKIDKPFPLRYQQDDRAQRQFALVKYLIPEYGGTIIGSHWGIEYCKVLLMLSKHTKNTAYIHEAHKFLGMYKNNIETYKGFPEVYYSDGKMVQGALYTSVRQTGWVVNFEQALAMSDNLS